VKPPISHSAFVISLDFELYWGIRDVKSINEYSKNLEGVQIVLPKILELFTKYDIQATWATVGFLFLNDFNEITANAPVKTANYDNSDLSPYGYAQNNINNNKESFLKLHFAPDLIKLISKSPNQEIASHTFSHYYCLEEGQTIESFEADLIRNIEIAQRSGIQLQSIVFPRNQMNPHYAAVLKKHGIRSYRGSATTWLYHPNKSKIHNSLIKRGFRYADTFFKICTIDSKIQNDENSLINIPASRFFQPFNNRLLGFERLKLNRIKNEMTAAAEKECIYHLWWHPHNFGKHISENLLQLEEILIHYRNLNKKGKMISLNMQNITRDLVKH
jgi:peptidoglycan/xylan/chitin deacetylase (PgdA/CDA1 family)